MTDFNALPLPEQLTQLQKGDLIQTTASTHPPFGEIYPFIAYSGPSRDRFVCQLPDDLRCLLGKLDIRAVTRPFELCAEKSHELY